MASRTFLVAQREYLENVRTKTFWFGILSLPLIIAISIGLAWLMQRTKQTRVYTIVDRTADGIGAEVAQAALAGDMLDVLRGLAEGKLPDDHPALRALEEVTPDMVDKALELLPPEQREQLEKLRQQRQDKYRYVSLADLGLAAKPADEQATALNGKTRDGELFAYFVFDKDPVQALDGLEYVSENFTDSDLRQWFARAATRVLQHKRISKAGIEPATAQWIRETVTFRERQPGEGAKTEDVKKEEKANKFAPIAFVYLLWIAVFTAAQMLLTNTVEEKSTRIIEVLLSSASPAQLMSGKIWGIGATGLTIVGSWVAFALLGVWLAPRLVPDLAAWNLTQIIGDPLYLVSFVCYFLAGYLLFAAMLVAIGSVCNSLKEAQNLQQPVIILLMLPLFVMFPIVQEPNGLMARVFTYIPIYTPFAMMNRASGPPPAWEYAVTSVIILVSVFVAFKAAGKVFRIGVLMTGNPPKLKEILGWLRAG